MLRWVSDGFLKTPGFYSIVSGKPRFFACMVSLEKVQEPWKKGRPSARFVLLCFVCFFLAKGALVVTSRCPEDMFAVLEALVLVGVCCFVWFCSFFNRGLQPTQFVATKIWFTVLEARVRNCFVFGFVWFCLFFSRGLQQALFVCNGICCTVLEACVSIFCRLCLLVLFIFSTGAATNTVCCNRTNNCEV